jgi:hypothetical protein
MKQGLCPKNTADTHVMNVGRTIPQRKGNMTRLGVFNMLGNSSVYADKCTDFGRQIARDNWGNQKYHLQHK